VKKSKYPSTLLKIIQNSTNAVENCLEVPLKVKQKFIRRPNSTPRHILKRNETGMKTSSRKKFHSTTVHITQMEEITHYFMKAYRKFSIYSPRCVNMKSSNEQYHRILSN
jgi:hypothetical protein